MKPMLAALAALAALTLTPGAARAQPASIETSARPSPKNLVSMPLLTLDARSLSLSYERFALPPRLSLAARLGVRRAAAGDYSGWTTSAGVALRYWVTGWAAWSDLRPGSMVGLFFAGQLDAARTTVSDEQRGHALDATLTLAETVSIGYRFGFWGRLEVTPSAGLTLRHEFDRGGTLEPWTRGGLVAGLTAGYLF